MFAKKGPLTAVIAPAVSYGVTECARGFAGAVSVPAAVLTAYVAAICDGLLAQGIRHVCLVNNHLEGCFAHAEVERLRRAFRRP